LAIPYRWPRESNSIPDESPAVMFQEQNRIVFRIKQLLIETEEFIRTADPNILDLKPGPDKWSKKEILGHLIDSALNNLQRFTEIQFSSKPFPILGYNQDELVRANKYQETDLDSLLSLWTNLNYQICRVVENLVPEMLKFEIVMEDNSRKDLNFLIQDYAEHMQHHIEQIRRS
jgi:hypothetical protein